MYKFNTQNFQNSKYLPINLYIFHSIFESLKKARDSNLKNLKSRAVKRKMGKILYILPIHFKSLVN